MDQYEGGRDGDSEGGEIYTLVHIVEVAHVGSSDDGLQRRGSGSLSTSRRT